MTTETAPASALMQTYAAAPVTFVSGSGTVLRDSDGKEYLDFLSGLAVTSLGHAHPRVAAAVERQSKRLVHVSNLFGNELGDRLARTLDRLVGDGTAAGGRVFFANSGAEANECAIKLARRYFSRSTPPGESARHVVVSAWGSFHGRTLATLHATGQSEKHAGFEPMPEGFEHVGFGDVPALEEATSGAKVAAVLLEAIQGEGGVVPAPPGYLKAVRDLCDERGILLIADEIQTGLGRTGRWFAFQRAGIRPDIVTVAKALGNGFPIGACWARAEVAGAFQPGDHGSTFGGQPLACAAALATLEVMEEIDAPSLAARAGARLADGLGGIDGVSEVRGEGLLLAAVLAPGIDAKAVVAAALTRGLVVNAPVAGVVRLAPPLTVSDAEIDQAVAILRSVLGGLR
ncbi:MAG TPA: acetylornithine transaminase [Acidimicrobiales bacterium]|nr:acetylornithine transaminase [Acidimicrobiales bacterium]